MIIIVIVTIFVVIIVVVTVVVKGHVREVVVEKVVSSRGLAHQTEK